MTKASEKKLSELHGVIAEELKDIVTDKERRTAADMANAIRFLKDNGVTANLTPGSPMERLVDTMDEMPFDEQEEIEKQLVKFNGGAAGRA